METFVKRAAAASRRALASPRVPFVCLWLVMVVCHMLFKLGTGDDSMYARILHETSLFEKLAEFYFTWSARTLVDVGLIVVNYLPGMVWRLANPVMVALCAWGLAGIANVRENAGACRVLCGTMLFYPWQVMASAGWITTTTAFLWPAAAALSGLAVTAKVMRGEAVSAWKCVLGVAAVLYAACMEQVAAGVLALLAGWAVYAAARRQRLPRLLFAQLGATLLAIVWILASPGIASRFAMESTSWFPTLGMKPVVSKIELGLSLAVTNLFCTRNWIFLFFCLLLAWLVWARHKNPLYRAVPLVPLAACLVFGIFREQTLALLPAARLIADALQPDGIITFVTCNTLSAYLALAVLYGCFCLCLLSGYLALGHTWAAPRAAYALLAGLGTHAMLGFSPTVHVSGPRTNLFFMLTLVGLAGYFYRELPAQKGWPGRIFWAAFIAVCALQIYSLQEMRIATGY